jgi:glycosyltransferase involved in cell wall biosynthesis
MMMSKGTIIYIGGYELPDKNAAAHRVLNNGKIFKNLGYDVVFIGISKEKKGDIFKTYRKTQGFGGYSIPYPNSKKDWIKYLTDISEVVKVIENTKDVKMLVCYNYQSFPLFKLKGYCNKNSIKIIADCTEWYSTRGEKLIYRLLKGFDTLFRMRFIQKKLDGIIVISSYLENYYKDITNLLVLPPLVDKSEEKWNIPMKVKKNKKIKFVYAGSPGKHKDKLSRIIKAFSNLDIKNNYIIYLIGITKEEYLKQEFREQNLKGIESNVEFLGRLSHKDSIQYLRRADYSIFVRDINRVSMAGFPTKFVESISTSTKVITNSSSDLQEYIYEGINGHLVNIEDGSLESLLYKILVKNEEEKNNIKNIDSNTFDFRNYINKTNEFLEKLIVK